MTFDMGTGRIIEAGRALNDQTVSDPAQTMTGKRKGLCFGRREVGRDEGAKSLQHDVDCQTTQTILYSRNAIAINLEKIDFYKKLMPGHYFSEAFCQLLEESYDFFQNDYYGYMEKAVTKASGGAVDAEMTKVNLMRATNASKKLSRAGNYVGELYQIGCELKQRFDNEGISVPEGDIFKTSFEIKLAKFDSLKENRLKDADSSLSVIRFQKLYAEQQSYKYPGCREGGVIANKKMTKLFHQLLCEKLYKGGIIDDLPEVFLGFVDEKIADKKAAKSAFYDSNWSLNLAHGKGTHIVQLYMLMISGLIDKELLKFIISYKLWGYVLDNNIYSALRFYQVASSQYTRDQLLKDFNSSVAVSSDSDDMDSLDNLWLLGVETGCSPIELHTRLIAGEFSEAMGMLSKTLTNDGIKDLLKDVLHITPANSYDENKKKLYRKFSKSTGKR